MAQKLKQNELENVAGGIEYRLFASGTWYYEVVVEGNGFTTPYSFNCTEQTTVESNYNNLKTQIANCPGLTIVSDTGVQYYTDNI